ncbi:antibiotic resistance protein VanZ [Chelatococcus reniformis]|uniref:Antibiotic resistance protein VanZ n=1 Tax=Chelatococcus reniformis TaxID=1494448 RepID=A0A916UBS0_9HYPH|nr:antibiotic resistance protein VanZ [Chelatococcus reniformis]
MLLAIVFVTLAPIQLRPVVSSSPALERLCAFGLVGLAFGVAYPKHRLILLLGIVVVAGGLEAAQNLTFSRHGRLPDLEIKGIGALIGLLASCIPGKWLRQRPTRSGRASL